MATMKRHRTRVGKRNQVTIPAAVLRALGVQPGDMVEVTEADGQVALAKADDSIAALMGCLWRPDLPVLSDEELEAEIKRAGEERATRRYLRSLPEEYRVVLGHQYPRADSDHASTGPGGGD